MNSTEAIRARLYGRSLTRDEIRLVQIESAHGEEIACKLSRPMPAQTAPDYTAVSWCWGDATFSESIVVNDIPMPVTPNLKETIKAIRAHLTSTGASQTFIWIDALCVNQADNDEKPNQVRSIWRVYKRAKRALFCLGGEVDSSEMFMTVLQWVQSYIMEADRALVGIKWQMHESPGDRGSWEAFLKHRYNISFHNLRAFANMILSMGTPPHGTTWLDLRHTFEIARSSVTNIVSKEHRFWRSWLAFKRRPWFHRVWTLQELYLSEDRAVVLCGTKAVVWRVLELFESAVTGTRNLQHVLPSNLYFEETSRPRRLVSARDFLKSDTMRI